MYESTNIFAANAIERMTTERGTLFAALVDESSGSLARTARASRSPATMSSSSHCSLASSFCANLIASASPISVSS